ncbi:LysM peptidoglycan-binding domain-containing protein [Marivita sp. S0852]|uniref:LysM peptidoglycan-binding domain-containing protein n=1 Tax=Marivita sp. S0852 TaxID=3373893 RepID=UPI003982B673
MTTAPKQNGLIRMVLMAIAFIGLTIVLVVFQPGSPRHADTDAPPPEATVTRVAPSLETINAAAEQSAPPEQTSVALPQAPKRAVSETAQPGSLRDMTFVAISNLKSATTGEAPAPGEPGSLLHSVVQRSIAAPVSTTPAPLSPTPEPMQTTAAETGLADTYLVQPGDTLVSIARTIYGDVNMASALFTANTDVMARPDGLRPGMVLNLPAP